MLIKTLLILGWIFTLTPVVIFLGVSIYMVRGIMKDDDNLKALILLGFTIFIMGSILLLSIYLTNLFG